MTNTPRRSHAPPTPKPPPCDIGDLANIGIQSGGKILCAHADRDGQGMHWKLPAENCAAADRNATL